MKLKDLLKVVSEFEEVVILSKEGNDDKIIADSQSYRQIWKYLDCEIKQISTRGFDKLFITIIVEVKDDESVV